MSADAARAVPQPFGHSPVLLFVDGSQRRRIPLRRLPFTIGRRVDKDLVLRENRCSRDHASIVAEDGIFYLRDDGSKLGTYVNGVKVERHRLRARDVIEFGVRGGASLIFDVPESDADADNWISKPSGCMLPSGTGDLTSLALLLETARKLNSSTVIDEVLVTVLDTSLRLTNAERGFLFLRDREGEYRMAAGRDARGFPLEDDQSISRSSLMETVESGCEFVVAEADDLDKLVGRDSVDAFGLSSVICIPLRRIPKGADPASNVQNLGVLYLDSHSLAGRLSAVSHDVLRTIATEAGALIENATLVRNQHEARRNQQELEIAAEIHQRLIAPIIPEVPFAEVRGRSMPCEQTGGDFFEAVVCGDSITVAVADVAGKGISAALMASVLQGMVFTQLRRGEPLAEVAAAMHEFVRERRLSKYATLVLVRLHSSGEMEIINCGNVAPVLMRGSEARTIEGGNPPVGLVPIDEFVLIRQHMERGDRLLIVSDGITDARDCNGEFYGAARLHSAAAAGIDALFASVDEFRCGSMPEDDCTAVEIKRI